MAKEVNKVLASIIFEEAADRHLNVNYSWSSSQQPPWGQKKVAIVERLKQGWKYGLSTKKNGCCREVALIRGSTVIFMYTLRPGAPVKTNRVPKWWRHKHEICEIMGFVEIFWKNNFQEAYSPKISNSGQIVSETLAQLCCDDSIQILLNLARFIRLGTR